MSVLPHTSLKRALQNLTHFSRVVHLLLCIFVMFGCQGDVLDITASQRALGEITSDTLDLTIQLSPGILRDINESTNTITGRASAGVGTLMIRTGPNSAESLTLELRNVHPDAQLIARRTRTITAAETLGDRCDTGETPIDLNCATSEDDRCPTPDISRTAQTQATITIPVSPCTETNYDLRLPTPQSLQPLSFVVVGSLKEVSVLGSIHAAELAASQQHDFYMLLGDAIEKRGNAFVSDLEDQIDALQSVTIITPGEEEFGDDNGQYFERRFGAFEYRWTIKDVQFISFYSAEQKLNTRALGSLRSSLRAMLAEDQQWRATNDVELETGQSRALPALAMTHTPLFDPSGPRNAGLKSRLEASQATSLLADAGVHTLFAGHIRDNAHVTTTTPNLVLTTSQDTRSDQDLGVYRRVTLSRESTPGAIPVGTFFMQIDTLPLP